MRIKADLYGKIFLYFIINNNWQQGESVIN